MADIYLDANFIISLNVSGHQFHQPARKFMLQFMKNGDDLFLSTLGVDEIWWVLQKELRKGNAPLQNFHQWFQCFLLRDFKNNGGKIIHFNRIQNDKGCILAVKYGLRFGLRPRDSFHLAIMQDHGIKNIATFDKDFDGISSINVIR